MRSRLRDLSISDIRWGRTMSLQSTASRLTIAFLLGLPASAAFAQSAPLNTLPEVVVSPTAFPTPSDQIGSSVTVITGEQLQRDQIRTVSDALKTVPGMNIVQTGGPGGLTSIFMRGTNSNHTKVLIDGIDISDPSNPGRQVDLGHLTTDDVERIEVLRGPQSGLYGADAMGGVISITTKKGSGPAKWTGMIEGGSFGTFNQAVGVSGGTDNSNYAFSVSHQRSDSIPVTPLDHVYPGVNRKNNFNDNMTYSGKVGVDISDIFGLSFVSRYTDAGLRYSDTDFAPVPPAANPNFSNSRGQYFYGLADAVWRLWDGRFNNHVGYAYTDIRRHSWDPDVFTAGDYAGQRGKIYWKSDLALAPGQKLLMGVEREEEKGRIDFFGLTQGRNTNTGAYAELHSSFGDRLFLTSNIRHDDNEQFGGHTTFRFAPSFVIRETGTTFKGSYGTGFHAPSIDQLYGFGANPNLKPEETKGYDFGFEQYLFDKAVQFGATYFKNDITNLIVFNFVPFQNENIGLAKTHGIEAFVAWQMTNRFQVRADYTHTDAVDGTTGIDLKRRPSNKTSVSAVWQPTDKWTLSATALWVSGWLDTNRFTFATVDQTGYQTINLAANYALNEKTTIFGRIDNLLDKRYENPNGFLATGFGIYAGLRMKQ